MLTTLRNSVTVQTLPRMGVLIFGFYHAPFVQWRGDDMDWWIVSIATGLTLFSVAIDGARWKGRIEQQRCARYWAEQRRRHGDGGWEDQG